MWSSSDNTRKEDLEDCSCSSDSCTNTATGNSSSAAAAVASTSHLHQKQLLQQQNTFDSTATKIDQKNSFSESNCNLSENNFSGDDLNKITESEIENISTTEPHDSGFISGPQTNIFDSEIERSADEPESRSAEKDQATKAGHKQLLNIFANEDNDDKEENRTVLDSGCIDVEFDNDGECDSGSEKEQQHKNKEQGVAEEAATALALHSSGGSAVGTGAVAAAIRTTESDEMMLKSNVDASMSEWFCNLSLQSTPTEQQQQLSVAGGTMNNFNAVGGNRSAPNASSSTHGSNIRSTHGSNIRSTHTIEKNISTHPTSSNAWEQFYQQNDDGDTPLHLACISGYVDVVAALIRMAPHPCLFNIQNDEAQTPLHLAVLTTQPKILRMLLIAGAEPTIRDRHGNTALHLACLGGEEQCVRALIIPISASEIHEAHRQYGHRSNDKTVSYLSCARLPSDLEIRNYNGERCVHLATEAGHIEVLRILVLYGADINAREGKSGRTPMHIAIECCNEDLVNFLLDECVTLNLETATYAGLTPYQVACILNKSQMQNILKKKGAEPLTPPDSDYDSDIESDLEDPKMYDRFGDPGYFINFNGGNYMTVA